MSKSTGITFSSNINSQMFFKKFISKIGDKALSNWLCLIYLASSDENLLRKITFPSVVKTKSFNFPSEILRMLPASTVTRIKSIGKNCIHIYKKKIVLEEFG